MMLGIRNPFIVRLLQMLLIIMPLSAMFSLLGEYGLLPLSRRSFFITLSIGLAIFYMLNYLIMRRMRLSMIVVKLDPEFYTLSDAEDPMEYADIKDDPKAFYVINIVAALILTAVILAVRLVFGSDVHRWLFALVNFMRFSTLNVSGNGSTAIFSIILLISIIIAGMSTDKAVRKKLSEHLAGIADVKAQHYSAMNRSSYENAGEVDVTKIAATSIETK